MIEVVVGIQCSPSQLTMADQGMLQSLFFFFLHLIVAVANAFECCGVFNHRY